MEGELEKEVGLEDAGKKESKKKITREREGWKGKKNGTERKESPVLATSGRGTSEPRDVAETHLAHARLELLLEPQALDFLTTLVQVHR